MRLKHKIGCRYTAKIVFEWNAIYLSLRKYARCKIDSESWTGLPVSHILLGTWFTISHSLSSNLTERFKLVVCPLVWVLIPITAYSRNVTENNNKNKTSSPKRSCQRLSYGTSVVYSPLIHRFEWAVLKKWKKKCLFAEKYRSIVRRFPFTNRDIACYDPLVLSRLSTPKVFKIRLCGDLLNHYSK